MLDLSTAFANSKAQLWAHCLKTALPRVGTVVKLPKGCSWLHEEGDMNSMPMLIRSSYSDLFDKMMELKANVKTLRGYVLTGNPGIGKSCFLSYCLWRFAKEGKTVIFESVEREGAWLFLPNGSVSFHRRKVLPAEASLSTSYYLFDPYGDEPDEPIGCSAFTIIASSPNKKHYKGFRKRRGCGVVYYMPCWSLDELKLIRPHHVSPQELFRRYDIAGGIPRYLFASNEEFERFLDELKGEFTKMNYEQLKQALGNPEDGGSASHKLVQYQLSDDSYRRYVIRFASSFVEQQLPRQESRQKLKELGSVLAGLEGIGLAAVLAGNLFEHFGHAVLPGGVRLKARRLDAKQKSRASSADKMLDFPKAESVIFSGDADLKAALTRKAYARPAATNYPAVDAIAWLGNELVFVQYTRSGKHGISDQLTFYNLVTLACGVTKKAQLRLLFMVPPQQYDAFESQNVTVPTRKGSAHYVSDIDDKVNYVRSHIEQWVVELKAGSD